METSILAKSIELIAVVEPYVLDGSVVLYGCPTPLSTKPAIMRGTLTITQFVSCRVQMSLAFREPLQITVMTVIVVTLPMSTGFLRDAFSPSIPVIVTLPSRWPSWRKGLSKRLSRRCDGHDACDDEL